MMGRNDSRESSGHFLQKDRTCSDEEKREMWKFFMAVTNAPPNGHKPASIPNHRRKITSRIRSPLPAVRVLGFSLRPHSLTDTQVNEDILHFNLIKTKKEEIWRRTRWARERRGSLFTRGSPSSKCKGSSSWANLYHVSVHLRISTAIVKKKRKRVWQARIRNGYLDYSHPADCRRDWKDHKLNSFLHKSRANDVMKERLGEATLFSNKHRVHAFQVENGKLLDAKTIDVKMVVFRSLQVEWQFETLTRFPAVKPGVNSGIISWNKRHLSEEARF